MCGDAADATLEVTSRLTVQSPAPQVATLSVTATRPADIFRTAGGGARIFVAVMSYLIAGFGLSIVLVMPVVCAAPLIFAAVTGKFHEEVYGPALRVREHPRRFVRAITVDVAFLAFFLLFWVELLRR